MAGHLFPGCFPPVATQTLFRYPRNAGSKWPGALAPKRAGGRVRRDQAICAFPEGDLTWSDPRGTGLGSMRVEFGKEAGSQRRVRKGPWASINYRREGS